MRRLLLRALDPILALLTYPAGLLLRTVRSLGVERLPATRAVLDRIGVFPIRRHYYEPRFDYRGERDAGEVERPLPGIDWRVEEQLRYLERLRRAGEMRGWSGGADPDGFDIGNDSFGPGDAEYWYQLIREEKPRRIIEVGSGNSTRVARAAIRRNREEDPAYDCRHLCIEPFEAPWLEGAGLEVVRERVEEVPLERFRTLEGGDVLFIDSSHVIRPGGDVLVEYLQLLPTLAPGVIVHVHDIFSPFDYPRSWRVDEVRLWNEQYLLEAFLTHNAEWEVVGALNLLRARHYERLAAVAPFLMPASRPGSLYLRRR